MNLTVMVPVAMVDGAGDGCGGGDGVNDEGVY